MIVEIQKNRIIIKPLKNEKLLIRPKEQEVTEIVSVPVKSEKPL
jgi:hypothetical protein